jgi:hypothetical protein
MELQAISTAEVHKSRECRQLALKRLLLIAALAEVIFSSTIASAQPSDGSWAGISLAPEGWTYLGWTDQTQVFARPPIVREANGYLRVWIRWELVRPHDSVSSFAALSEYDCALRRTRNIQVVEYSDRNLQGSVVSRLPQEINWTYDSPETLGDLIEKAVCGN